MDFGIEKKYKNMVEGVLLQYPYKFYAFGSRSTGKYTQHSDLDLCVFGSISIKEYSELKTQLLDLLIPFSIDIVAWNLIDQSFKEIIKPDLKIFMANNFMGKKIVDLTHEINNTIPVWAQASLVELRRAGKNGFKLNTENQGIFRVQDFCLYASTGTHIDFPAHISKELPNATDFTSKDFCSSCNIFYIDDSNLKENLVITKSMIKQWEDNHWPIEPNSWFLIKTGWVKFWNDPKKYRNANSSGIMKFPKINQEAAEFLLKRQIKGIGIDTLSPDGDDYNFPVHKVFLQNNIYIIENVNFSENLKSNNGFLYVSPLLIKDLTESPVRLFLLF